MERKECCTINVDVSTSYLKYILTYFASFCKSLSKNKDIQKKNFCKKPKMSPLRTTSSDKRFLSFSHYERNRRQVRYLHYHYMQLIQYYNKKTPKSFQYRQFFIISKDYCKKFAIYFPNCKFSTKIYVSDPPTKYERKEIHT